MLKKTNREKREKVGNCGHEMSKRMVWFSDCLFSPRSSKQHARDPTMNGVKWACMSTFFELPGAAEAYYMRYFREGVRAIG